MINRRPYRLVAIAAGVGLLASCTSSGTEEATTPPTIEEVAEANTESYAIAYDSPTADDFNKLLTPTDNLVNLQQAEILNVDNGVPGAGGFESSTLVISFEMESHHCFGVQTAVTESDSEVVVEILTGQLPTVDPTACEYGIYPYTTELSLSAPIAERTIVPAEQREPVELGEPGGEPSTGGITDSTGATPTTTTNPSTEVDDTDTGDTGGAGDDNTTSDPSVQTTQATAIAPPNEQAGARPPADASDLIGKFVEEGVEWALDKGLEWRVLSFDGDPFAEETPFNPERISFVVEADHIVSFEWS